MSILQRDEAVWYAPPHDNMQVNGMKQVRVRLSFLVMCGLVSVIAVACGRASSEEINSALNITPTPTLSEQDVADQTAAAISQDETRTAAQANLGSPTGDGPVDLASAGDPVAGKQAATQRCLTCHKAGGTGLGPDLAGPSSPVIPFSDQQIFDMIRTGDGHTPPGPLTEIDITDPQLINIISYLREIAK